MSVTSKYGSRLVIHVSKDPAMNTIKRFLATLRIIKHQFSVSL